MSPGGKMAVDHVPSQQKWHMTGFRWNGVIFEEGGGGHVTMRWMRGPLLTTKRRVFLNDWELILQALWTQLSWLWGYFTSQALSAALVQLGEEKQRQFKRSQQQQIRTIFTRRLASSDATFKVGSSNAELQEGNSGKLKKWWTGTTGGPYFSVKQYIRD